MLQVASAEQLKLIWRTLFSWLLKFSMSLSVLTIEYLYWDLVSFWDLYRRWWFTSFSYLIPTITLSIQPTFSKQRHLYSLWFPAHLFTFVPEFLTGLYDYVLDKPIHYTHKKKHAHIYPSGVLSHTQSTQHNCYEVHYKNVVPSITLAGCAKINQRKKWTETVNLKTSVPVLLFKLEFFSHATHLSLAQE